MLWGAAALCFVAYGVTATQGGANQTPGSNSFENLVVGIALLLVILVTALFSFVQTVKTSNVMAAFAKLAPQVCIYRREESKEKWEMRKEISEGKEEGGEEMEDDRLVGRMKE